MNRDQALKEIARLQKIVDAADAPMPEPLAAPNWEPVRLAAIAHIEELNKDGFADEDSDHWFYEAVMEAVYGKDVWKWINEKSR